MVKGLKNAYLMHPGFPNMKFWPRTFHPFNQSALDLRELSTRVGSGENMEILGRETFSLLKRETGPLPAE